MDELDSIWESFTSDINTNDTDEKEESCCDNQKIIIDNNTRETICTSCGTLINKMNNISYDDINENSQRCMIDNSLLPKTSMLTYISGYHPQLKFLKQIHLYNKSTDERGLIDVFNKIDKIFQKCELPKSLIFKTKYYYKTLCYESKEKGSLTRGEIRTGLIIACIKIAYDDNFMPITEDELSKLCNIDKKIITRGLKRIAKIEKNKNISIIKNNDNIHYFIRSNCHKLKLSESDAEIIHLLYERIIRLNLVKNNTAKTISAGLIYTYIYHYRKNITKKQLIKTLNITEVTINKIHKLFYEYKEILFIGL